MSDNSCPVTPASSRIVGLDVLRGVAILLVLGAHAPVIPGPGEMGHLVCSCWQRAGWMGVDLFFVLSGFLITTLLLRERERSQRIDAKAFLIRRVFKIYPP